MVLSRREFLRNGASAVAVGAGAPMLLTSAARAGRVQRELGRRALVVLELNGGNDALNTVIPIRDRLYHAMRPTLAINHSPLMLNDRLALHPAMAAMHELYRQGKLAIVQGVGYPEPSRSHFRSLEVWHRGETAADASTGWLGRISELMQDRNLTLVHYGQHRPELFAGQGAAVVAIPGIEESHPLDPIKASEPMPLSRQAKAVYPQGRLGHGLASFAQLIMQDSGTKLFYISQGGFDTHARQAETHGELLGTVSSAIGAFLADLRAEGREQDVMVMAFSEFGRRLKENSSAGTDHGTAGVVFFAGGGVCGGLYGRYPSLSRLVEGDLLHTTDFRDCYATVLENWLGTPPDRVLAGRMGRVEFVA